MVYKQRFVQFPWNKFILCINFNETSHFNGACTYIFTCSTLIQYDSCCYPLKSLFIQSLSACLRKKEIERPRKVQGGKKYREYSEMGKSVPYKHNLF